ncbi:unnamed protein product [Mycena citricolor]|uniref:Cyclin N-terminal domain-containing protein n=1 Tax=Mycena citricolor TaxID=2018698 RepID=A0AAD2HH87_9AGAR|nr:unnamed protein product [Mycena citricolor]
MSQRSQHTRRARHQASLLPVTAHNPGLVYLMGQPVTLDIIIYIARQMDRIFCSNGEEGRLLKVGPAALSLEQFIYLIVKSGNVHIATLLATLIYLERLRSVHNLDMTAGRASTRHRVFLATLIVSAKYLNDSSPKNVHWAAHARHAFTLGEVNLMEQQLLALLDYDLRFDEEEACTTFAPFISYYLHARSVAVDPKVLRSTKARPELECQEKQQRSPVDSQPPCLTPSSSTSSTSSSVASSASASLVSTVRGIAKRLSQTHLSSLRSYSSNTLNTPSRSCDSSSSSEIGSLVDDTGSSSSSSSGWASDSDSESDTEPCIYSDDSTACSDLETSYRPNHIPAPTASKRLFVLRPAPYCGQRIPSNRSRKPSDTSSVNTVMAASPQPRRSSMVHVAAKRASGLSVNSADLPLSATMPSIPRPSASGSFLSRMWGAARGERFSGMVESRSDGLPATQSALKRLVLVHSRSNLAGLGRGNPISDPSLQV